MTPREGVAGAQAALAKSEGLRIHLVGAKGTGMCALAEILAAKGAVLSGSDVSERFYTDDILAQLPLRLHQGFDPAHVGKDLDLVIHSSAYRREDNPELLRALDLGIPLLLYTEALGALSLSHDSSGIAGVHGKTTTTALSGAIVKESGLPAIVLAGSAVSSFGGRSTFLGGDRYLIAETCEYQRHFLSFHPRRILLTSVESDHQDCFPRYEDILGAFVEYGKSLPEGGSLIHCADDEGAVEAAAAIREGRPDIRSIAYGSRAEGPFRLEGYAVGEGRATFRLSAFKRTFSLAIPGFHIALDAAAAIALCACLIADQQVLSGPEALAEESLEAMARAVEGFRGSKRRSEILGEAGGILFMDDYAHHPTAIARTLEGLRAFHPSRRIVVDFMSHTYSRTAALLDEFASSFTSADFVVLHGIYASAREKPSGSLTGRSLYDLLRKERPEALYWERHEDAFNDLAAILKPGDLFITMGAGDNWKLGQRLYQAFSGGRTGS